MERLLITEGHGLQFLSRHVIIFGGSVVVQQTSNNLNEIIRLFSDPTLSDSEPAAPSDNINVTWQFDIFGNISAYVPSSAAPSGDAGGDLAGTYPDPTVNQITNAVLVSATPTVAAGEVGLGTTTASTATEGSATLPAAPVGFLEVNIGGTMYKIPYYNV